MMHQMNMMYSIILVSLFVISGTINAGESQSVVVPRNSSSVTIIDELSSTIKTSLGRRERRLIVNDEECTLFELASETMASLYDENVDETIPQIERDEWLCEFDKTYSREVLGLDDPLVRITGWSPDNPTNVANAQLVGRDKDDIDVDDIIESGRTRIKVRQAIIDRDDQTMYMGSEYVQIVRDEGHLRRLQSSEIQPVVGTRRVLAVRISTNDFKYVPAVTGLQLKNTLFGNVNNQVTMRRKFFECSYRKLQMLPYKGTTKTGVQIPEGFVNIKLNGEQSNFVKNLIENGGDDPLANKSNRDRVLSYCRLATEARLGNLEEQFDHVVFVLPEQVELLALAIIGRWDSYYGWSWILRPSMPLHEIGHNLGLDHAGELNIYDDKTGYMGFSYDKLGGPSMCYNPANSYFLGWYKKQTDSFDAETSGAGGKLFTINGVADYRPKTAGTGDDRRLVVLRLTQKNRSWDYYVGYNRAKGINKGTEEDRDEILIVRKNGPPASFTTTKKIGTLGTKRGSEGEYFEIEDYNGNGSIFITFEKKRRRGKDVIIRISTTRPTQSPSESPTPAPTISPSSTPTTSPSVSFKPSFEGELRDRNDFKYKNVANKDCEWVGQKLERCSFTHQNKYIQTYWCRKTCEFANWCLRDLDNLNYNNKDNQNCAWVAEDLTARCNLTWRNKKVTDYWCPTTCNPDCNRLPANAKVKTIRRRQES